MGDSSPGLDPQQDEALFGPEESDDRHIFQQDPLQFASTGIQLPPPTSSGNVSPLPPRNVSPLQHSILNPTPLESQADHTTTPSARSKRPEQPHRRKSSTPALFIPKSSKGTTSPSTPSGQTPTIPKVPADPHVLLKTLKDNKHDLITVRDALTSYLTQLQVEERTFVNGLRLIERARKRPADAAYPELQKLPRQNVTQSKVEPPLQSLPPSNNSPHLAAGVMHISSTLGDPSADVLTTLMDELDRDSDPEDEIPLGPGRHIAEDFGNAFQYASEPNSEDDDDDDQDTGEMSFTRRILQKFANEAA